MMDNHTAEERQALIVRLETIASWRKKYGENVNVMLPAEEAEKIANIALASLTAEPDYQLLSPDGDWLSVDAEIWHKGKSKLKHQVVYPFPPVASAVPDELIPVPDEFLDADQNEKGLFELSEDCMCRLAVALAQQSKGRVIPPAEIRVPDGWKLVPAEPTDEMIAAAMDCDDVSFDKDDDSLFYVHHNSIYTAMLAAAPSPIASE
ncbi:hypothetical protein [Biostraticola tofi]|uniref:Eaa protein n=1 Tax=Biostraticola tofi TaxID=466109 RepID=A0A4R3Z3P2_9GAMM|nr:hypothetical protein [Biostraticola tofi]TCW00442.1 hypothetical protein EDC52_101792 [Biostraticola tofi]